MLGTVPIYASHFGLKAGPFSLLPDPNFLYWSDVHGSAYAVLEYALLDHAPLAVITGEVGAGKTTLIRRLMSRMPEDFTVGLVSTAHGDRGELLQWVLKAFDLPTPSGENYVDQFSRLEKFLIDNYAAGKRALLIFDEAQNLSSHSLEELRLCTNINSERDLLIQIILVGQPELRDKINAPGLSQFSQRIAAAIHLTSMPKQAVRAYIEHRLSVAGAAGEIFTPEACARVSRYSGGTPRIINKICEHALVYAYSDNAHGVGASVVDKVVDDWVGQGFGQFDMRPAETEAVDANAARDRIVALYIEGLAAEEIESKLAGENLGLIAVGRIGAIVEGVESDMRTYLARRLTPLIPLVVIETVWISVKEDSIVRRKAAYLAVGVDFGGVGELIGLWIGQGVGRKTYQSINANLKARGLEEIFIARVNGLESFVPEIAAAFPQAILDGQIGQLMRRSMAGASWQHRSQLETSLRAICQSSTGNDAQDRLDEFAATWGGIYPDIAKAWIDRWSAVATFIGLHPSARAALLAMGRFEPLFANLHRVVKAKAVFNGDSQAQLKLFVAAIEDKTLGRKLTDVKSAIAGLQALHGGLSAAPPVAMRHKPRSPPR